MRTVSHQYSNIKKIIPGKGDTITELNFIKALKVHHTVTSAMSDYNADVSFIRAHRGVFRNQKGIRLWMATPFHKDSFEEADYIFTFTDTWTKMLREGTLNGVLNPDGKAWGSKVITVNQVVSPDFYYKPNPATKVHPFHKMKRPDGPVVGIFGRLALATYPHIIYKNIEFLKRRFPGILFIIGSSGGEMDLKAPTSDSIMFHKYQYWQMPQIYNACDAVLVSQRGFEWEFCGSLKTLEPAACGTPVICERSSAREEVFGKEYPLFLRPGSLLKANEKGALDFAQRLEHALGWYTEPVRKNLSKFILDKYGLNARALQLKTLIEQL